jgi:hypothetical protein
LSGPTVPDIETVPDTGSAPATEIVAGTESVPRSETIPSPPSVSDTDLISDTDQDYPRSPRYQKPKPRRARSVEDGHSHSEQSLYEALWERARHYNADCRVITMGFGSMSHIARLSLNNCRQNVRSLIRKLALEELCAEKCDEKIGKTYLIYNPQTILRRRKAAGLEWVIRTKGVVFIDVASGAILTDRTPDSSSTGSASASDSVSVPDTVSIGEEP